jgi:hypothetical protein
MGYARRIQTQGSRHLRRQIHPLLDLAKHADIRQRQGVRACNGTQFVL